MLKVFGAAVAALLALSCLVAPGAVAATGFEAGTPFSGPGAGPGQLTGPQRVAVEQSAGHLLVADQGNDRVQVFDTATDTALASFGDASSLDDPYGVAVDQGSGAVYVSSAGSLSVTRWVSDGLPVPTYTRDLAFASPPVAADPGAQAPGELGTFSVALAVDPVTHDLLVADVSDNRVQRYSSAGAYQAGSDIDGSTRPDGAPFSRLSDLAVDASGDVLTVDIPRVDRFNGDGSFAAGLESRAGAALIALDPSSGDPVVAVSIDAQPSIDHAVAYDGTAIVSSVPVPPAVDDYTFPSGLGFTAAGKLYVATGGALGGCCGGTTAIVALTNTATLADVTSGAASAVTETSATVNGTVDPNGAATTYRFEYSTDQVNWTSTPSKAPWAVARRSRSRPT